MPLNHDGGWTGKLLRVDLTSRTITVEDTFPTYEQYWGGAGFGMRVLWNEVAPGTDPHSAANKITFNTGVLNGTGAPSSGRACFTTYSPVNPWNAPNTGHFGGFFGPELKYAGYDAIIIEGKASGPVYLKIIDSDVEIVDCPQIWGVGTFRAQAEISQAMGGKTTAVAAIGQSGESLQPQSAIMTGWKHAGSTAGDVMGSKNLKAIGVQGTGRVRIAASKKAWRQLIENAMALIGSNNQACAPNTPQPWAEYVSASGTRWWGSKGRFWGAARPVVETGTCEPHDRQSNGYRCWKIDWVANSDYLIRMDGCFSCPVRCNSVYYVPNAEDYGVSAYGSGTCTGSTAFQSSIDTAPQNKIGGIGGSLTALEIAQKKLTSQMMGDHFSNDNGWTCNYGMGGPQIKWLLDGGQINTLPNGAKAGYGEMYIKPNVSAAEWAMLTKVVATPSATNTSGLFDLIKTGNLQAYRELARIITSPDGNPANTVPSKLGRAMGGAVEAVLDSWVDAYGRFLRVPYFAYDFAADNRTAAAFPGTYWGKGHPEHHLNGWVGLTSQVDYNRDPQNHQWQSPILGNGFPDDVGTRVLESQMFKAGLGTGWGAAYSMVNDETNPPTMIHAKAAQWNHTMKECVDALGTCNWMYPWIYSPLKERDYEGDETIEAQYFNLATGNDLPFAAPAPATVNDPMTTDVAGVRTFYGEMKRFWLIHRALTARCMKVATPPAGYVPRSATGGWADHFTAHEIGACGSDGAIYYGATDKGNMRLYHDQCCVFEDEEVHSEWATLMDNHYANWGLGNANGLPTRATLESLDAKDIADTMEAEGLLGA